jgi:hypothetical protein
MKPTHEDTPSARRARILRASLATAALASVISLTSGCVVAVRPAPPPPPPVAEVYTSPEEVVVTQEPPQPYTEVIGIAPGPGFFWVGGYWHWYGNRWVWYRGHYARPPHPGAVWVGPRYVIRGGARVYVRGYWRP